MTKLKAALAVVQALGAIVYRFKPGRTFAQTLGAALALDAATTGILDVDLAAKAAIAASVGLASFLMIWGEGGDMLADDARVTGTKTPAEPDAEAGGYWGSV